MADEGWIKLYRAIKGKPIWKKSSPEHKVILITLLLMANHEDNEWEWMGHKFKVNPGQFITSLEGIKDEAGEGISIQNIRSALQKFEKKYEFLINQSTKTGRLITIVNWELYQSCDDKPAKKVTKSQQRGNKEVTSNKNDKNDKNERNRIIGGYTANPGLIERINDFIDIREKMKKPMTVKALSLMLNKLSKIADNDTEKMAVLEESIANSWQGIFPLKSDKQFQGRRNPFNNFKGREYDMKKLEEVLKAKVPRVDNVEEEIAKLMEKRRADRVEDGAGAN